MTDPHPAWISESRRLDAQVQHCFQTWTEDEISDDKEGYLSDLGDRAFGLRVKCLQTPATTHAGAIAKLKALCDDLSDCCRDSHPAILASAIAVLEN